MSTIFQPTSSKETFVGRQVERQVFGSILEGQRPEWIIHIPGEGGIGKTRLLEMIRQDAINHMGNPLITRDLVDFYNVGNQTDFGLLGGIAESIDPARFEDFFRARTQFEELLKTGPEPAHRQDEAYKVLQAFLADYRKLLQEGKRVIWFLDTCEEMGKVEQFVIETLLPAIHEQELSLFGDTEPEEDAILQHLTLVVIAGRKTLTFPEELSSQVTKWRLQPLSLGDVKQFFGDENAKAEIGLIDDDGLDRLYNLTGGRPMYIALSYDWLKNEVGTIEELLSLEEPFGEKLVGWVRRLDTLDKRVILYTALAWRRMEPSLLAHLLDLKEEDAASLIQGLSKFSFVKYRPPSENYPGAFQLHDEMRDLIVKYVGLQEGEIAKNELLGQVITWYVERIGDPEILEGRKLPSLGRLPTDLERALLVEWLYYLLQYNFREGFERFDGLFRHASHNLDLAFCEMLNREVERFSASLDPHEKDDLQFKEALVAFRRDQYGLAGNIWHSLIRQEDVPADVRAKTLMMLVELDSYQGKPDEAVEHALECKEIYESLLAEADPEQDESIKREMGYLYNNWGYAHRVTGDYEKALEYFDKALAAGGQPKNIARTLNNMGFIHYLRGDIINARTYVGRALQMRRTLKIPYELGLGYNTMGIIMEHSGRLDEAADSYHKAQSSFEIANSDRGRALVLMNIGRIDRQTNRFEEAEESLKKAISVFEQKRDLDNLIQVLNELGVVYRQRGAEGDWEKAEELHKQSLAYARQIGRSRSEADNWEDLCILYERRANELRRKDDPHAEHYENLAREAAGKVTELAKEYGYHYLQAKKERTLADLAFGGRDYQDAFDHYFEACQLVAHAKMSEKISPVYGQRRYEMMVDRLQEQLQALPTLQETKKYSQLLLERYQKLDKTEQEQLASLKEFLVATNEMASKVAG